MFTGLMDIYDGCYCCPKPSTSNANQSAMDLDSALNELGMLSSVTDSHKQYEREKERQFARTILGARSRNLSEPSFTGAGTPSNSPTKGVYQVVQFNSQFITSLSSGLQACTRPSISNASPSNLQKPAALNSSVCERLDFGERYRQEELEQDAKANRLSRLKMSRVKRFRKPYELPWRQALEKSCNSSPSNSPNQHPEQYSTPVACVATPFLGVTPEKNRPADKISTSNSSTPEKSCYNSAKQPASVIRSKSLDDLDLSKLRLAESENQNFVLERKEIDNVSQHLRDMHVAE